MGKSLDLSGKNLQDFIVQQQEFEREERRSAREPRKTELELSNRQKERESEEKTRERRKEEAQERQRVRDAEAEEGQKQREHDLALASIRNEELRRLRGEVEGSVGPTIVAKSPPKIDVPKFENKFLFMLQSISICLRKSCSKISMMKQFGRWLYERQLLGPS